MVGAQSGSSVAGRIFTLKAAGLRPELPLHYMRGPLRGAIGRHAQGKR